jgi:hypothetical protein
VARGAPHVVCGPGLDSNLSLVSALLPVSAPLLCFVVAVLLGKNRLNERRRPMAASRKDAPTQTVNV